MLSPAKKERNIKLDLLRFTGVLIIMIAHAGPPGWLDQLRNFGTPLLIFGSALTYAYIYKAKTIDRWPFYKKRLKRLIIPAWIFLTFFFLFVFVVSLLIKIDYPFPKATIFESYTFYYGIGFVWIFKVYIILALITPLGLEWSKSSISNTSYFSRIFLIYIIYEVAIFLFFERIPIEYREFISTVFLVVIPYSIIYLYGLRAHSLSNRKLLYVILSSLLVFVALAIEKRINSGSFIPTQNYKYPPTLYYLSYAFFCTNLFYYLVFNCLKSKKPKLDTIIVWLSENSLWIYLWHIMAIYFWGYLINYIIDDPANSFSIFIVKFAFLLMFGIALCYLQIKIVAKLLPKSYAPVKRFLSYLK